jgi:hypothetical protein
MALESVSFSVLFTEFFVLHTQNIFFYLNHTPIRRTLQGNLCRLFISE